MPNGPRRDEAQRTGFCFRQFATVSKWQIVLIKSAKAAFSLMKIQHAGPGVPRWPY
jgi:hypothetical protein